MTVKAPSYSLRDDITTVLNTTDLADPGDIADKVVGQVPENVLRETLRLTLRAFVREMVRQHRNQTTGSSHNADDTQGGHAAAGSNPTGRSWARDAIRTQWRQHLNSRFEVAGTWKLLTEMTATDLDRVAADRQSLAERNAAAATRLEAWAALVREYDVDRFGALPESVLAVALGGVL